jgi:phospholipid/cholesterol/gamma-HCH transport system ATP-binding protein
MKDCKPIIEVRGLRNSFGEQIVHENLDLDVYRGEILGVVGGSGTGKSVLIKCILGILRPDAGSIRIDGAETVGLGRADRTQLMLKFGMLFQGSALFDSLSVWENVAFGLTQGRGMPRQQAREVALQKLASVGCRAACRNGWRWHGQSRLSPRSCSSTSRRPGSTRSWPTSSTI